MRANSTLSSTITPNTGTLQDCVLSPPLFYSLFTSDCTPQPCSVELIKFADDTTLEASSHGKMWQSPEHMVQGQQPLLTIRKTKEMLIDLKRKKSIMNTVAINSEALKIEDCIKFLGFSISNTLSWDHNAARKYNCRNSKFSIFEIFGMLHEWGKAHHLSIS